MNDRERLSDLANAALAGDERAYGMLVGALWPNAYRIAWSILGDPSTAEDAAQAACIAICAKLGDISDVRAFAVGVAAQASGTLRVAYAHLFNSGSSKPLPTLIHRADRLTIAQVQRQVPFSIVVPVGLPAKATFEYAHVVRQEPVPNVALYTRRRSGAGIMGSSSVRPRRFRPPRWRTSKSRAKEKTARCNARRGRFHCASGSTAQSLWRCCRRGYRRPSSIASFERIRFKQRRSALTHVVR